MRLKPREIETLRLTAIDRQSVTYFRTLFYGRSRKSIWRNRIIEKYDSRFRSYSLIKEVIKIWPRNWRKYFESVQKKMESIQSSDYSTLLYLIHSSRFLFESSLFSDPLSTRILIVHCDENISDYISRIISREGWKKGG